MVTKKEIVYESESEPEVETKPAAPVAAKKASPPAPAAKKQKLMASGAGTKQPGIMSFFKKK